MYFLALLLLTLVKNIDSGNVLVVAPFPAKSHFFLLEPLARELAERGHTVTFITALKTPKPPKNFKEVLVEVEMAVHKKEEGQEKPDFFAFRHMGAFGSAIFFPLMGMDVCDQVLSNPAVKQVLNSNEKFDVIIGEAFLTESLIGGLSYKLKSPLIGYGTFMPSAWVNYIVGNDAPTSYIPEPFGMLPYRMNFFQRFYNFFLSAVTNFHHLTYYLNRQDEVFKKHFGQDTPHIKDVIKNTSFLFVNDHFATSFPRPMVPNLISIGGLHVKPPKPLPEEIQKYMDNSPNGVILFSMGSNLQSKDIDVGRKNAILKAFGRLKENVLWKFEDENLPNKPKNVFINNWLPQSDILAHPNLKLFITHGGLLSTTESIDRGVPLVGIPIFGDQPMNMKQSENAGVGKTLSYDDLSEDLLYETIQEVINNPKYKEAAQSRSKIFKDNPQTPMERAVFWTEYTMRHKGASHLRSASQDLLWYEYYQLDVLVVILLIVFIALSVTKWLTTRIWNVLFSKSKSNETGKSKSKNKRE